MIKIETVRHSLAHILAYAVRELYPGVKFGIGPVIENGFYYDFDFSNLLNDSRIKSNETRISEEDLPRIEKKMRELIKQILRFEKKIISLNEAKKIFKNQPYKLELIEELKISKQPITIYQCGDFIDLCKGPHIRSTKEIPIDAFKLTKISGAYWKGDEKNPMLTRIYGVAFENKKALEKYLKFQEEAEKRDHRVLGQKLDLFHIDENVGPGLILWHPKGALIKKIIIDYALNKYLANGYQLVDTPHIAKLNLWKTSGHLDFYKENMMPPMHMKEIGKEEKDDYQIKPMNCPFHIAVYKTKIHSYKDLPVRFTEIGTVYRYEKSGTLHGLTRVRQISQDDAHIFCTPNQLSDEILSILKLTQEVFRDLGIKEFTIYLSTRPEKYIGTLKDWEKAENAIKYSLEKLNLKYQIDKGGGAFYGPKIDIKIKDAIGREWQCTTIQIDFNLPKRFDVAFVNEKGKKENVIMVHRALLGSLERFIGVLLEYYAGALPLWLSPEQIWIIPIGSNHVKYAKEVTKEIISKINSEFAENRIILKNDKETVSKKIREGEIQKIPYLLVVGDKEMEHKSVRVRER
ncbi:MAG TPA: threonine--tRNA ligase, partial [Candidatus Pacearchaeota archaeon]|nr:threonine--tRNA ligase [Candidatus Pacearchaeota archaeon]HPZ75181.1 threonine--tRNA ligase [Candidatus Pacearchaeota archaeon]